MDIGAPSGRAIGGQCFNDSKLQKVASAVLRDHPIFCVNLQGGV